MVEQLASFHTTLEDCRNCYQYYSDAADAEGYKDWMEEGVSKTLEVLEYLKTQTAQILSGLSRESSNTSDIVALDGFSKECAELARKTALLRERKQSILTVTNTLEDVKARTDDLFEALFAEEWFQKYTNAKTIDDLMGRGITHGIFERGKQEKLLKTLMMDLDDMDNFIGSLMCLHTYEDKDFGPEMNQKILAAISEMTKACNDVKTDQRMFRAAYNKHSELFIKILQMTGNL